MDTDGSTNGFLTDDLKRTGRVGKRIDIGKREKLGAFRTIEIDPNHNRDRN
jgi:hypothetical protein